MRLGYQLFCVILLFGIIFTNSAYAEDDIDCPPNSHPSGGVCLCDYGYVSVGGMCISCSSYCNTYRPNSYGKMVDGQCGCFCKSGYVAYNQKCVACDVYCYAKDSYSKGYIDGDNCLCKCHKGYTIPSGGTKCTSCDSICKGIDKNSINYPDKAPDGQCFCDCKEGFVVNEEGKCDSPCPEHAKLGEDGLCYCDSGYVPYEEKCVLCDDLCKAKDPNTEGKIEGEECVCYCKNGSRFSSCNAYLS